MRPRRRTEDELGLEASFATISLSRCSSFYVDVVQDEVTVQPVRPSPAVCATCGRCPDLVQYDACPKMLDSETTIRIMAGPRALHGDL